MSRGRIVLLLHGGRCTDCELRENREGGVALNSVGQPRRSKIYGYSMSGSCEGCGGTGVEIVGKVDVTDLMANLTAKQRFVLELRYGIRDGHKHTQQQVADLMGIAQRTVSEHEAAGMKKLRDVATKPPSKKTL